jgi:hypothetical protein
MTGTKKQRTGPETVTVVVVVNHGQLRRGEVGEVDLTDDVRGLLDRGYLRLAEDRDHAETAPPLGGTPAPVPGPVTLLGVTPGGGTTAATPAATTTTGGTSVASGAGNTPG